MKSPIRLSGAALVLTLGLSLLAPRPAAANGAASTRNIIFGAAALGAGTLIVLNHNKKVHQKYAEYDRRQAQTQAEANQAEAAYESERAAYGHEAALVNEYQQQTAYQHSQVTAYRHQTAYQRSQVVERDRQIAALKHSLFVAKYGSMMQPLVNARSQRQPHYALASVSARPRSVPRQIAREEIVPPAVSYGWGNY